MQSSRLLASPTRVLALLSLLTCADAYALTPAEVAAGQSHAEQIQREQQLRQREQYRRDVQSGKARSQLAAPTVTPPERGAGPCRQIRLVRIEGIKLLKAAAVEAIAARYSNRCLGVAEIEKLLADVTNAYIKKGYIAVRAYLPEQDLTTGVLIVKVIEGKVEKINVIDGGKGGSINVATAAPGVIGKPLNLRDFEQALDQVNRLASNNATFDIQPGTEPGDSIVAIGNQPSRRLRLGYTYDNYGSPATGEIQKGMNLSWDNPLGLNDFLSLTNRATDIYDTQNDSAESNSLTYIVPYGYSTATLSMSRSNYTSAFPAPSGSTLHTKGDADQDSLRLDRTVYRSQSSRWNLASTLTLKEANNYLEDVLLRVSSRRLTLLDLDSSFSTGILGGALTLDTGYSWGLNALDALEDAIGIPDDQPHAQFGKWKYGFNYALPFKAAGRDWSFTSALVGQKAEHVLYGSEQSSVGGIYTVRGFVENTLAGDDGFYWRNDLSVSIPFQGPGGIAGVLRPYVAIDHGSVHNRVAEVPNGSLTGAAIGFNLKFGPVSLDVFHAHALSQPNHMEDEGDMAFVTASITL